MGKSANRAVPECVESEQNAEQHPHTAPPSRARVSVCVPETQATTGPAHCIWLVRHRGSLDEKIVYLSNDAQLNIKTRQPTGLLVFSFVFDECYISREVAFHMFSSSTITPLHLF